MLKKLPCPIVLIFYCLLFLISQAPEVIKGETVALPADLWSLGALTFTL